MTTFDKNIKKILTTKSLNKNISDIDLKNKNISKKSTLTNDNSDIGLEKLNTNNISLEKLNTNNIGSWDGNRTNIGSWDGNRTNISLTFDIDLTLVHTFTELDSLKKLNAYNRNESELRKRIYTLELHDVVNEPGEGVYSRMWGVYRPGWERFHNFSKNYFYNVFVWSAGQPRYVDAMVNVLFPDPNFQPSIVYTWDNCQSDDGNIYKPLENIYSTINTSVCHKNILALDDRDDTYSHNPKNGILIPPYEPSATKKSILQNDTRLLELENWFRQKHVANCEDVRTLDKSKIFV